MWLEFGIEFIDGQPVARIPVALSTSPPSAQYLEYAAADADFHLPYCVFRASLAPRLGIPNWRSGTRADPVLLYDLGRQEVWLHPLSYFFRYGDQDLEGPDCLMGFCEGMPTHIDGILGRDGFFGRYQVQYDLVNSAFSVNYTEAPPKPLVYGTS